MASGTQDMHRSSKMSTAMGLATQRSGAGHTKSTTAEEDAEANLDRILEMLSQLKKAETDKKELLLA